VSECVDIRSRYDVSIIFASHLFKTFDMPSKSNKRVRKQVLPFEWILASNKRSDRRVAVVGERIILSSLRHPSLNIIFTINRLAHFVAMLQDVNEATHLRPLERKATG